MSDAMKLYDAGLLGGGHLPNADWWQDYLRAEIERANDFCGEQYEHLRADLAAAQEERDNAIVQRAAERLAALTAEKALAAAQEREQRMREAGLLALKVAESWIHDQCDGTDALAPALAELDEARGTLSALGEPQ